MFKYGIFSCGETTWFPDFETALHDYVTSANHVQQMFNLGLITEEYAFQLMPQLVKKSEICTSFEPKG